MQTQGSSRTTDPTHIPHSPSVKNCTNGKSWPSSQLNSVCISPTTMTRRESAISSTIWVSHCMKDCVFYCEAGVHITLECSVRPPHLLIRWGASVGRNLLPGGGVEPGIHTFTSLTTSNSFFVAKKGLSPCIDYRAFNNVTSSTNILFLWSSTALKLLWGVTVLTKH